MLQVSFSRDTDRTFIQSELTNYKYMHLIRSPPPHWVRPLLSMTFSCIFTSIYEVWRNVNISHGLQECGKTCWRGCQMVRHRSCKQVQNVRIRIQESTSNYDVSLLVDADNIISKRNYKQKSRCSFFAWARGKLLRIVRKNFSSISLSLSVSIPPYMISYIFLRRHSLVREITRHSVLCWRTDISFISSFFTHRRRSLSSSDSE